MKIKKSQTSVQISLLAFVMFIMIALMTYTAFADHDVSSNVVVKDNDKKLVVPVAEQDYIIEDVIIDGKAAKKIKFTNLNKSYDANKEAKKDNKKSEDYIHVKKTKYHGDVEIKLMHYVNITIQNSYNCKCIDNITYSLNGTEQTSTACDTCYTNITNEVFQEIDPETFILKNNEPIYEVMGKVTKFEKTADGWGYAVWTDVNVFNIEIEGATWWNATFLKKKKIQINNTDIEVANYSLLLNVTYDSDMSSGFEDIRFANSAEDTILGYWIESKSDNSHADVWVRITDTLTNITNTTVYMYYDNSSAVSSESNGQDTFLFFDDFSDGDYTSNPTWTVQSGTWSAANGYLEKTSSAASGYISTISNTAYGVFDFRVKITGTDWSKFAPMSQNTGVNSGYLIYYDWTGGFKLNRDSTELITTSWSADTDWHDFRIVRNNSNGFEIFHDGVSKGTKTDSTYTSVSHIVNNAYAQTSSIDKIKFYKYLKETPIYSFGAEIMADSTPEFSLNEHNSTYAREDTSHNIYISTSGTLDCAIFSFDNGTGSFVNDTVDCSITGSDDWFNVTKTVSTTIEDTIRWQIFANSTEDKWGASSIYTYDTVGNLHGTVTDSDTSQGIEGATIWIIKSSDNTTLTTTQTDSSGDWNYDMTSAMTVHIMASKNSTYEADVKNNIDVS